jgi:hypothetical protein
MPGPSPLYRPKFSRLQLAEARELVRQRRVPHSLVQRAQLVLLLAEEPTISNPEAGRRLGIHENTVRYWRYRWATEGFVLEDRPLSRLFIPDIIEIAVEEGVVDQISPATVWRLLDADALKPWRRRSWIWPRDPLFYERAAPALDLYAGYWHGKPLGEDDFVLSADEKTSIQARRRLHRRCVARDGRGQRVDHEYERMGAWAYMAAWDVHQARVFGRVEEKTGIEPFGRLIDQVMRREPYRSARRVFWIVDGGSSHHRSTFPERLQAQYRNAVAVVLPVHASWINQIEIYFSILERKVLTPNDFADLPEVRDHIMRFGREFSRHAEPFDWTFTRKDLRELMTKLRRPKAALRVVVKGRAA